MICDICRRPHHAQKRPFLCPMDVRNSLYEGRISHTRLLLENEEVENKINTLLADAGQPETPTEEPQDRKTRIMACLSEHQRALDSSEAIQAQADKLRLDIAACRREAEERKVALARRKADLVTASDGLENRRMRLQEDVERTISNLSQKWDRSHEKLAATRAFLCLESAKLYGLRRSKRGSSSRYDYLLGGTEIIGLSGLNDAQPQLVSSALVNIAHILVLASHYLAIRLPAEITLPHNDYPRPTIFPIDSSYQPGEPQYPGTQPPLHISPRELDQRRARPRPLYLDKPLKVLAKDDPSAYSFFLEGLALLAYDIAWACTTQGVHIGDKDSIEDFCSFGRNLYNLLIGNSLHTNSAARIYQASAAAGGDGGGAAANGGGDIVQTTMGRFSHGAAHDNLCSAEGTEFLGNNKLKLPSPIRIADKLKRKLKPPAAEWELLEHPENLEDTVLVSGTKQKERERQTSFDIESVMTEMDPDDGNNSGGNGNRRVGSVGASPKTNAAGGTNGWTKLRNR